MRSRLALVVWLSCPAAVAASQETTIWMTAFWKTFKGYDSKTATLSGIVDALFDVDESSGLDPRDHVSTPNFMTGNPGRVELHTTVVTPTFAHPLGYPMSPLRRGLIDYVGDFAQAVSGTCFPWEALDMKVLFSLYEDEHGLKLGLFCHESGHSCAAFDADGQELEASDPANTFRYAIGESNACADKRACAPVKRIEDTRWEGSDHNGFRWAAFVCEVSDNALDITCTMRATRAPWKPMVMDFLPGVLFSAIGFGAFFLKTSSEMPRVATTMLSLLCFTSKTMEVLGKLPPIGVSWIDTFYAVGAVVMFMNVIGASFLSLKAAEQRLMDSLMLYVAFPLFYVVMMGVLLHKSIALECAGTNPALTVVAFVVSVACLLVGVAVTYRQGKVAQQKAAAQKVLDAETRVGGDGQPSQAIMGKELERSVQV